MAGSALSYKLFIFWNQHEWGYFRRRKESLTREFVKNPHIKEIVYVETAMTPVSFARKLRQALFEKNAGVRRAAWLHVRKGLSPRPIRLSRNLLLFNPVVPFPLRVENALPLARKCNLWLLSLQMRVVWNRFCKRENCTNLVLFSPPQKYTEYLVTKCEALGARIFADLEDDILDLGARRNMSRPVLEMFKKSYAFALAKCRLAFAVESGLAEKYGRLFNTEILHVPNGVNIGMEGLNSHTGEPGRASGRKTVLYIGNVNDKLDDRLAEEIVSRHPDVKLDVVGPLARDVAGKWKALASKHPNLSIAGPLHYDEAQKRLAAADVLLQLKKPELSIGCDSLKLYEYLTTGKPIVTTDVPPVGTFAGLMYVVDSPRSCSEGVERALRENDAALAAARREAAANHSWAHRVQVIFDRMTDEND